MFIEIKASKSSLGRRKSLHGVGVNDADYMVSYKVDGKKLICPYYKRWHSMLTRCYSSKYHDRQPTYKDCSVSDSWLVFSNFRLWMEKQDFTGKALDKDVLTQGNKIYSESTCVFISQELNNLLCDSVYNNSGLPKGVSLNRQTGKFVSECKNKGKKVYLGCYKTTKEAHDVYKEFKLSVIRAIAKNQQSNVKTALLNYKIVE